MTHDTENSDVQSPAPTNDLKKANYNSGLNLLLVILFILCAYAILTRGLGLFNAVAANLPLLLPLVVTLLSILTRAGEIKTVESVLKISNDLAIGIISFDIWAISASKSDPTGRVLVNSTTMINGDFVLPFLLAGLVVAVGCVVLTRLDFKDSLYKTRWLGIAFGASLLVYIAPFGVLQPIQAAPSQAAQMRQFTVAIPYQDPVIISFAPTYLRDRQFFQIERNVAATTLSDAKEIAVKRFLESTDSDQVRTKNRPKSNDVGVEKVNIRRDDILVVER
jgi:hypothetical protein